MFIVRIYGIFTINEDNLFERKSAF